ncbi:MAG: glycosyltransferase [Bacteroidetes bacterium]|nr:glycosyltransferase [Bacteroidota bacterium]
MLKISVVIPSYNQGEFLEETIQSIISQEYPNLEIILIDGNSSDNSLEIINKYSGHFKYWVSEKDSGQSEAINKGLQRCTGDIATWLCSDDLFTPGALQKVNQVFSALPQDVGLIHGSSIIFSEKKTIRINKGNIDDSLENMLSGMTFPQPSAFFRRSLLEKTGFLDESLHFGMDYDLFSKFAIISKFQFVDHTLSKYRLHTESKSVSSVSKFIDDWSKVFVGIAEAAKFESALNVLKELDIYTVKNDSTYQFFVKHFKPENIISNKLLFKFLCFVLRYDYESERFSRAKRISKYLNAHFHEYLLLEPEINTIVWRSYLPPTFIKIARKISRRIFYS